MKLLVIALPSLEDIVKNRFAPALILLAIFTLVPVAAQADLDRVCKKLANDIAKQDGKAIVHFRVWDFKEIQTGRVPNLSQMLHHKAKAELSKKGLRYAPGQEGATHFLSGTFKREGKNELFFFELIPTKNPARLRTFKYSIRTSRLPKDAEMESLDTKVSKVSGKLLDNPTALRRIATSSRAPRVLMGSMVDAQGKFSPPFARDFMARLRSVLLDQDMIAIVMPRSATRGLKRRADTVKNLEGSAAVLGDADAVLEGFMRVHGDTVHLEILIRDKDGTLVGSATERLPRNMARLPLTNPEAVRISAIADTATQPRTPALSKMIRVSTDKPGRHPIYKRGETLHLTVMARKPLYIYIFDINPQYGVQPLYPLPGESELLVSPGQSYVIPPIEIVPPYGMDAIKVFASTKPLGTPTLSDAVTSKSFNGETRGLRRKNIQKKLSSKKVINPMDLVDFYRGKAVAAGATLFEDTIYVSTRAN